MKLRSIAQIRFGLYAKPVRTGKVAYIQAKQLDKRGNLNPEFDTFIYEEHKNHLLEDGDILLVGKGLRNFAWVYDKRIGPAIASSIFYVIKPEQNKVLSEYLTMVLNSSQTQSYFQTLGAGSSIPSIRKSELQAFPIQLPPLRVQQKAVELKQIHDQDMELSSRIIEEKQKRYQAITNTLILNYHE